jgi:hypothetical protein
MYTFADVLLGSLLSLTVSPAGHGLQQRSGMAGHEHHHEGNRCATHRLLCADESH